MFTHLGNGCPTMLPRHDNIIQRVLSLSDRLWISFIANGAHLPFFVLRNLLRTIGPERAIIVTDATAASGMGPGRYRLGEIEAVVGDDLVPRLAADPQYLAGWRSRCLWRLGISRQNLRLGDQEISRLCIENPRKVLGIRPA